jgi:hypothetical protein
MIGREYSWQGRRWRVVCRWRAATKNDPYTFAAPCCGHLLTSPNAADYCGDETLGDESYCGSCGAMWTEHRPAGHHSVDGWRPGGRPVIRNVLIEDVETGERVVRPFRGLRRARATVLPERPVSALAWELRGHLAAYREIRVTLTDRCDGVRTTDDGARILQGRVSKVSPTDAYAIVCGVLCPLAEITSVKRPHSSDGPASDPRDPFEEELVDLRAQLRSGR